MGKARHENVMIPVEAIERVIGNCEKRVNELKKQASFLSACLMIEVYRAFITELRKVVAEYGPGKP